MAYRDENGRITIDETAAAKDIRRLREAAEILGESRDALRSLLRRSEEMRGETAQAIREKTEEMEKRVTALISQLENGGSLIQRTVNHYRDLDEQIRREIEKAAAAAQKKKTPTVSSSSEGSSGGGHSGGGGRDASGGSAEKKDSLADIVGTSDLLDKAKDFLDGLFKK